jgi:hydrogenase maturation protein HypF
MIVSQKLLIKGTVQGVGFRPFIHRVASEMGVKGWVRNIGEGVEVEVQADSDMIEMFRERILSDMPPGANIKEIVNKETEYSNHISFEILGSKGIAMPDLNMPPDMCICSECSKDISDKSNRRNSYPFTSCVNCGPRFTILDNLPYDRRNVTMRSYIMGPEGGKE